MSIKVTARVFSFILAAAVLMLCGCSGNNNDGEKNNSSETGGELIEHKSKEVPSSVKGGISFEEACSILDKYSSKEFYLPQAVKEYKKYYFGTIDYMGDKYYSIYPYIEAANKKIFMGTNCLVSCDGQLVLKKAWTGDYAEVTKKFSEDKSSDEIYPDAKASANDAVASFAEKEKNLKLDNDITKYVFEVGDRLYDRNGIKCYKISPKLEYMDHIEILQAYYVAADGSGEVYKADLNNGGEYSRL